VPVPEAKNTRIAVVGDVHAHWKRVRQVRARIAEVGVDGVLLVGDFACAGRGRGRTPEREATARKRAARVVREFGELQVPVFYVPGNHDLPNLDMPGNIDGRQVTIGDLSIAGLGGAGPDRFGFAYEWDEAEIERMVRPEVDLILAHAPPKGCLDLTRRGKRVGSTALRAWAEAHHGVMVFGHIHESGGVDRVGDCLCLNAGGLGHPHGAAQVGFVEGRDKIWYEHLPTGAVQTLLR